MYEIACPSPGADLRGLMKAAYYDPNPVVIFEHRGLYWSKVKGTEAARTILPDEDYIIPFGKARIALEASPEAIEKGESLVVATYGMGVHWALNAAKAFPGRVSGASRRGGPGMPGTTRCCPATASCPTPACNGWPKGGCRRRR